MKNRPAERMAVSLALITIFTALVFGQGDVVEERIAVKALIGQVEMQSSGSTQWRQLRVGMPVRTGWSVRTFTESSVDLEFSTGTIIKISENSVVTVSRLLLNTKLNATKTTVGVSTGQVWANVKKLAGQKSSFQFETPTATASIRGTQLGINIGHTGRTELDVYEGAVAFRPRNSNKEVMVSTRMRAIVEPGKRDISLVNFNNAAEAANHPPMIDPFKTDTAASADTVESRPAAPSIDTVEAADSSANKPGQPSEQDVPELNIRILSPADKSIVAETPVVVKGMATPGALVMVMGKEVSVGSDGSFSSFADVAPGENTIAVGALYIDQTVSMDLTVNYHPALVLNVWNVVDNMEVMSNEISLDIEVTEGARFSVNGRTGETKLPLREGPNQIAVKAWDPWGNTMDRTYTVVYAAPARFELRLISPTQGMYVREPMIPVSGSTVAGARVFVNDAEVTVSGSGFFSTQVPIPDEPQEYSVEVRGSFGDEEMTAERLVVYERDRKPLELVVTSPGDGQTIRQRSIMATCKVSSGAAVTVNGRQVPVPASGVVNTEILVGEQQIGDFTVDITASRDDEEINKTVTVNVDGTSPLINTSQPDIVVQGHGQQATRSGKLIVQVSDRTPDDEIRLIVENNGSVDEYEMASGARQEITLDAGVNNYTIRAKDAADNPSQAVTGKTYYLPGPLVIDINEPTSNPWVVDDLPPLPRDTEVPRLLVEVEVDDGIGGVPQTIKSVRLMGNGASVSMKSGGNGYVFTGTIAMVLGRNAYTVQAEDIAGNIATRTLVVDIEQ